MGSATITCAEGHTFDAPDHLATEALALHNRTVHFVPERTKCVHEWPERKPWDDGHYLCRKCGKIKMVF